MKNSTKLLNKKMFVLILFCAILCTVILFCVKATTANAIVTPPLTPILPDEEGSGSSSNSYTTTDRLYITIPDADETFTFKNYGGGVNKGTDKESDERAGSNKTETLNVNNWFDIYIKNTSGGKWYVQKTDAVGGKWYFDKNKYTISDAQKYIVYLEVREMPIGDYMRTFIENGDKLYTFSNSSGYKESIISSYVSYPCINVTENTNNLSFNYVTYKFTEESSRIFNIDEWTKKTNKINGPDDFSTNYGLNPQLGTYIISSEFKGITSLSLNINYSVGAINTSWTYGRCQNAHRSSEVYTYNNTVTLNFKQNTAVMPTTKTQASTDNVSATWATDGLYAYATYKYNDKYMGEYTNGKKLSDEGRYVITTHTSTGKTSDIMLYVDKTKPTITVSSISNVSGNATWSVGTNESPVTATYVRTYYDTSSGKEIKTNALPYTSGTTFTDDGKYTVTAIDEAGNKTTANFVVDKTPPRVTFNGTVLTNASGTQYTNSKSSYISYGKVSSISYDSAVNATYSFESCDNSSLSFTDEVYKSGTALNSEGTYTITTIDEAGNKTKATVVVDLTPPNITFKSNGNSFDKYTNLPFVATSSDGLSGVKSFEIMQNGLWTAYGGKTLTSNGEYEFKVTDRASNSATFTAVIYNVDTFGNQAEIKNGYKTNSWYVVTLPSRIFTTASLDMSGRYSFPTYEQALDFAIEQEQKFRVSKVQGGYIYVSSTNESVAQKYDTEESVLAVVKKYASNYVSSRQTSKPNGNDNYYDEIVSLTDNTLSLPDYLFDLTEYGVYFMRSSFTWQRPTVDYVKSMSYTVSGLYLGDLYAEQATEFSIPQGQTLKDACKNYRQGYYLITECDEAGNVEKYIVYVDCELPTARVTATFGDGNDNFILDYEYTKNETLHFLSLSFEKLIDNVDGFVMLKIEKNNGTYYYTQNDELPVLGEGDFTSGKYTVTVYDRSLNTLSFNCYIAGSLPKMTHSSLASDKNECKLYFVLSDSYNVITSLSIYKIEYDGTKTVLDVDGNGTTINAAMLSYTLTVGGKYGATLTDNYRRTIVIDPVFFLKGLPNGTLSGVKDGGRTKNNVAFTFENGNNAEFYVLKSGGVRTPFTDYTVQLGSTQTTYYITASDTTSFEYLVFLHNADDLSLYVEYEFEIDTILPDFSIKSIEGDEIATDGATNKAFSLSWTETGVKVSYYTASGGSLSTKSYSMNTVLAKSTLYYFTIKDDVGNTLDFTVLLDNAVDFDIDGKYNAVGSVMYSNAPITVTVNEPTQTFNVENVDGYTIDNGGTLTHEGRYDITVTDNYNNTIMLTFVLDFTPPTLTASGSETTNNSVRITASDYTSLYLSDRKGNKVKDVESGATFSDEGIYYVVAIDEAGNKATLSFSIDTSVDYALSVPNGALTTDTVRLTCNEDLTVIATLDGEMVNNTEKFNTIGVYELTLTDDVGNTVTLVFAILPKRSKGYATTLPSFTTIASATKDGEQTTLNVDGNGTLVIDESGTYELTLSCGGEQYVLNLISDCTPPTAMVTKDGNSVVISDIDKDDVTLTLTKDGNEVNVKTGTAITDPGHYVLTLTDDLGNASVIEFDVPYTLNTWAIAVIVIGVVLAIVVIVLVIRSRRKPKLV